jgi:hypothetical protein
MPKAIPDWIDKSPSKNSINNPYIGNVKCEANVLQVPGQAWSFGRESISKDTGLSSKSSVLDSVVEVRKVLKGGSSIVGSLAVMSLLVRLTSGTVVIDTTISVMLLVGAITFYLMAHAKE